MLTPSQSLEAPVCSICIANYNGITIIEECLSAVLAQDCDLPFEIIVHDDASTDGSIDLVRAKYPDIRIISSNYNVGFCASNNRMAAVAQGEYLLLLNNDATLLPDALRTLHNAAVVTGECILGLPQYDATTGLLVDNGYYCDIFSNPIPNREMGQFDVAFVSGACLWIKKSLWEISGGFPDWFGSVAEDMYLCARVRLNGHPVRALGESGFRHHIGFNLGGGKVSRKGRLVTSIRRRALSERNKTYAMILTYPPLVLPIILPLHLFFLMLEGIVISLAKGDLSLWRKVYSPIIPSILMERTKLATLRRETMQNRNMGPFDWIRTYRVTHHKALLVLRHGLPEIQ